MKTRGILAAVGSVLVASNLLYSNMASAATSTSFYIVAHEDDWQLFMNPNAWKDAKADDSKVVFIYTTAGDSGTGIANYPGTTTPYYKIREEGAKNAVEFIADTFDTGAVGKIGKAIINGHNIRSYTYKNTVSYFFQLPDGGVPGTGFPYTGSRSLNYFRSGALTELTSVNGRVTFYGWSDLTQTIAQLIKLEAAGSSNVTVNISDSDNKNNPYDHSDHVHTSLAVQEAIQGTPCINKRFYVDYASGTMPANLSEDDFLVEAATWGATVSTLTSYQSKSTWDDNHNQWIGRMYFREVAGTGACNF